MNMIKTEIAGNNSLRFSMSFIFSNRTLSRSGGKKLWLHSN